MNHDHAQARPAGAAIGSPERVKILVYHRVVKDDVVHPNHRLWATNVDVFRNHLKLLDRNGFTTITLEDYHLFQKGELNLPKRPVIITFDDGYEDTHQLAFPVLREYGMKAVVFVVVDPKIRFNYWDKIDGYPPAPLMSREQIIELHAAGFEIGSHSLTHPRLTEIERERAWEEISRSRMSLEILLNAPVHSFSYPYGLVSNGLRELVHQAGYSFGCGVYSGPARFGTDPFNIRRIHPSSGNNSFPFWSQVALPFEKFAWMRWKLKHLVIGDGANNFHVRNGHPKAL